MYISWVHYYLPKIFGILSYIFNVIFIIIIMSEHKSVLGKYRYMLIFFAIFDMVYSTVELFVPIAIHGAGSAFVIYLTDGPFYESARWGQLSISIRCGFISLSYGILIIHFLYRYFAIFNPQILRKFSKPSGMLVVFLFFIIHGIVWSTICEMFLYTNNEVRAYIVDEFRRIYKVDSNKIPMLSALYMITRKFATQAFSRVTRRFHKQIFKALVIQTVIPICISFAPCLVAWYGPVMGLNLGKWNNYLGVIALSAFPVLDPLAVVLVLPNYRNKIIKCLKFDRFITELKSQTQTVTHQTSNQITGFY